MSKKSLSAQLLALEKNAPAKATGLSTRTIEADLHGESRSFELTYLYVPAQNGSPDGPPVVLIHGTPSTLFTWVPTIYGDSTTPGLSSNRDVYAIEVIGHGMAIGDGRPYRFESCARFVEAAIRGLGLEKVYLVGNSYGGEFAWRTSLNAPDLIAGLVLMHPSGYARLDDEWLPEEIVMRDNPLAKIGWLLNSKKRVRTALEPHFDGIPPDRDTEIFLVCENAHNWKAMIDLVRDESGSRQLELPKITSPTLILWGSEEMAYPLDRFGRRFEGDIPGSLMEVLPGCGHYPQEQRPDLVAKTLREFFAPLDPQSR
ncbi:MAG: alpha/beta hydrolase [Planctomycetota bacterium]|nr:alpha/beta hydrolase [Planctomycetota bacterium]